MHSRLLAVLSLLAAASFPSWAEPGSAIVTTGLFSPTAVLDKYVLTVEAQQHQQRTVSMDVDMDADLPQLQKHGRFHAFRFITRVGQIFYDRRRFEGDNTIKKEVIGRYLQAEKQARSEYSADIAVIPANYKFKYKGVTNYADRVAYVFQVTPKRKRIGLYKGELWIDQETYLPLREWGVLAKNPSVFLKNVYFVRDYAICDGISVPRRLISDISTRLFGKANLTIWYKNFSVGKAKTATADLDAPIPPSQADGGYR
jgi:hypothetical protein